MAKSWDIQPSSAPRRPAPPPPAPKTPPPPRRFEDIRPPEGAPKKRAKKKYAPLTFPKLPKFQKKEKKYAPAVNPFRTPSIPLGRKRRLRRKRILTTLGGALLALLVIGLIVLWQPALRVSKITVEGSVEPYAIETAAQSALSGTRFLIVPKDSIFFIPEKQLRASLLARFPEAEAISLKPVGLTTLSIRITPRAAVLWWCGATVSENPTCYKADSTGLVFSALSPDESAATTSNLMLYAPLAKDPGDGSPLGSTIANAQALPQLLEFVKAMRGLGADVVSVVIRGDEADLYTLANTRITYVLGREKQAAELAASAFPSLNLNDGSLLYVDLRFDSKVYFKKK